MNATWLNMIGPLSYEPDYDAHIRELESYEEMMANVACYDDWFVEELA
jgi:hypothetical protein